VKWKQLSARERAEIEKRLAADWQRCALRGRFRDVAFEVLDATVLKGIQRE
jgi:hypothetical protein